MACVADKDSGDGAAVPSCAVDRLLHLHYQNAQTLILTVYLTAILFFFLFFLLTVRQHSWVIARETNIKVLLTGWKLVRSVNSPFSCSYVWL